MKKNPKFALNGAEFKELKQLMSKLKAEKLTTDESRRLAELETKRRSSNTKQDFSWYNKFPELIQSAGNIAWNQYPGIALDYENNYGSYNIYSIPNVMVLEYFPTFGESTAMESAINTISRIQFLQMHRKYRNMGSYEQADLGITMLVLVNAFTMTAWAERCYGILNYYEVLNKAVPVVLADALSIDLNAWDNNLADFRYQLNRRIKKLTSVCLPRGLTILERQVTMNTIIFKDSKDNIKQPALYAFQPYGYYTFDGTFGTGTSAPMTTLASKATGTTPSGFNGLTPSDVIGILDDIYDSILDNTDVARICSDILAAYTRKDSSGYEDVSDLTFLNAMPEDYIVTPVYDENWLLQIHNADVMIPQVMSNTLFPTQVGSIQISGAPALSNGEIRVYQVQNTIINTVAFYSGSFTNYVTDNANNKIPIGTSTMPQSRYPSDSFINTWKRDPSIEDNVEMTRLKCPTIMSEVGTDFVYQPVAGFGSEIILNATIYSKVAGSSTQRYLVHSDLSLPSANDTLTLLSGFDWHPAVMRVVTGYDGNDFHYQLANRIWDLDNIVRVPRRTLERLHDACVLSELTFPLVESFLKNGK